MTRNKNQNIFRHIFRRTLRRIFRHIFRRKTYLDLNNLYGYAISKFLPTSGFKQIDAKEFELNKYTINSSK